MEYTKYVAVELGYDRNYRCKVVSIEPKEGFSPHILNVRSPMCSVKNAVKHRGSESWHQRVVGGEFIYVDLRVRGNDRGNLEGHLEPLGER